MKYYQPTAVLLLLSISIAYASSPEVQPLSTFQALASPGAFYSNGIYYYGNGQYYNSSSGVLVTTRTPVDCSTSPSFTFNVKPFCINIVYDQKTTQNIYYLVFLSSNLTNSKSIHKIANFPSDTKYQVELTQEFIIFGFFGSYLLKSNFTVMPFHLGSKSFICTKENIKNRQTFQSVYTNGTILVYSIVDSQKFNGSFITENCSNNETTTTLAPNMYTDTNLFAFNDSQVIVNYFVDQIKGNPDSFIEAGVFNSGNQLIFGPQMRVSSFAQYNDTHMFITYKKNGIETFGLFIVNAALIFFEVTSFNLGSNVPIEATPIYGTSDALIVMGNEAAVITYSFITNNITQVGTPITPTIPIILSNGSVVNTTQYGYFIQTPNEPIYFIQAPFSNILSQNYQEPSDPNQTYTLFVPSVLYNYSDTCLLTNFNASSSEITQTKFPYCPLTLSTGNPVVILDIKYQDGTVYVCYRETYDTVYIVSTTGLVGTYTAFYTYRVLQVSMNLTNGTVSFAGTQLTSFVLGKLNISSGAIMQTKNIVGNNLYNSIVKVTDRYYALTFGGENTSACSIYDMFDFKRTIHVEINISISFYNLASLLVYGFSEENPSNLTGFVSFTSNAIIAVNSAGNSMTINPKKSAKVFDAAIINEDCFIVSEYQESAVDYLTTYQIVSWGSDQDEIKVKSVEEEY